MTYEIHAREFEAKLLLAAVAASRGWSVFLGPFGPMVSRRRFFPPGLFWITDAALPRRNLLLRLKKAHHRLIAGDEEGVVHYNTKTFIRERINQSAVDNVEALFMWGDVYNDAAQTAFPQFASKFIVSGNPRMDLLREQFAGRRPGAHRIRERYGSFVLIVSNFGAANIFHGDFDRFFAGLVQQTGADDALREFYRTCFEHQHRMFKEFLAVTRKLADHFPDTKVVVRPHPSEAMKPWMDLATQSSNIVISKDGGIVDWLAACRVMIHNGCTTAIEGLLIGSHCIAFRPVKSPGFELELPNSVSETCSDASSLIQRCSRLLSEEQSPLDCPERSRWLACLSRYITGLDGALACERIVDGLDALVKNKAIERRKHLPQFLYRIKRAVIEAQMIGARLLQRKLNISGYRRPTSVDEVRDMLNELKQSYPGIACVKVSAIGDGCFQIAA